MKQNYWKEHSKQVKVHESMMWKKSEAKLQALYKWVMKQNKATERKYSNVQKVQ